MNVKKLIREIFKGVKRYYILTVVFSILAILLSTMIPIISKFLLDSVIGSVAPDVDHIVLRHIIPNLTGDKKTDLKICTVIIISLTLASALCSYFVIIFSAIYAQKMSKGLRDRVYNHILRLPKKSFGTMNTGDIIQRCTSDIELIATFFATHFFKIFKTIVLIGFVLYFMLGLDKFMTVVSLSTIPFLFAYCVTFFLRVSKYFEKMQKSDSKMTTILQENLTGVRVVKAFARQKHEIKKYKFANKDFRGKLFSVIKAHGEFWTVTECFSALQLGLVIIIGAISAINGNIAIGVLVAFLSYAGEVLWPVKELSMVLSEAGKVKVSLKRIAEILNHSTEDLDRDAGLKPNILGSIVFRDVRFKHDNLEVLKGISFRVEPGESLGIIGETGSGKTSLVQLLHRIYDDYTGEILIDDINIKEMNPAYLREVVAFVLQDSYIFSRTVENNIRFGKHDANRDQVVDAANKASIHDSITKFDKDYDTVVGESGVTLSGGQKQRLSIARSIIQNKPIIVFDDSLSAVDSTTDRQIRDNIKDDKPTSIIISHRVSTLRECDKILVLEHGKVTAFGHHKDIKGGNNLYKRILDIQAEVKESFHMSLEEAEKCLVES